MKIGSLVVCVEGVSQCYTHKEIVKGKIYTIRFIDNSFEDGIPGVGLEEVENEIYNFPRGVHEGCYNITRFRELDTPTSISIEEIITQEV